MNYLTLDLDNGDLVLSDNSEWKSLNTWLDGGTLYSDYYDASNCGDFWVASSHWISIDSESTYLTFTIEYEFIDATATDSCLCQIKFDGFEDGGVAVTADSSGLNISTDASKHINCDYSNANIKIDITVNLLTKEITTYIHKDNEPLAKKVNVSNYSFTEFVIQAGSRGDIVYKLPTTTKLLNLSVSDVAVSYSNFPETIDYIDKRGLAKIWTNTKSYITSQLLGKSNTGHTHSKSDVTDLFNSANTWTAQNSFNSDLNLNYASTDVDDIVNSVAGSATLDNFVHMTGNETVNGIKSFPDGVIANVTGSATSATNDGSGNVISTTYGKLGAGNEWTGTNKFTLTLYQKGFSPRESSPASNEFGILNIADTNDSSVMSINYANRTTGARDLSFRVYDSAGNINGVGVFKDSINNYSFCSIDPNNLIPLGTSTNQWKSVYAQNYYYNGTQWGLDQANVWSIAQTIRGQNPDLICQNSNITMGSNANVGGCAVHCQDTAGNDLAYVSMRVNSAARTVVELGVRNTYKNGILSNDQDAELISSSFIFGQLWNSAPYYQLSGGSLNDIYPLNLNGTNQNLGTSTYKWKAINGLNPGSLSLPNLAGPDPIDIKDWNKRPSSSDGGLIGYVTVTEDGWLNIQISRNKDFGVWIISSHRQSFRAVQTGVNTYTVMVLFPVVASYNVSLYTNALEAGDPDLAFDIYNFYPAKGNV